MLALQPQTNPIITWRQNEELPEDTRAEIFEGQIYDMASPLHIHQTILLELAYPFTATIKVNVYEGLYINFAENDDLINI